MIAKKTHTKEDLARYLARAPLGISVDESQRILACLLEELAIILSEGEIGTRIELRGFGVFTVRENKQQSGNLPGCENKKSHYAKRKVFFKPSSIIKKELTFN